MLVEIDLNAMDSKQLELAGEGPGSIYESEVSCAKADRKYFEKNHMVKATRDTIVQVYAKEMAVSLARDTACSDPKYKEAFLLAAREKESLGIARAIYNQRLNMFEVIKRLSISEMAKMKLT